MATFTQIQVTIPRNSTLGEALTAAQNAYSVSGNPLKTGYSLASWNTAADGSGTTIALTDTVSVDTTVYAIFTADIYTISFNANGGSGIMTKQLTSYRGDVTLSACTFSRMHYTFVGWALSPTGAVIYADEETIYGVTTDILLYAVWEAVDIYTVSYDNNGGSGTIDDQLVYADYPGIALRDGTGFTKTGYTLSNWNTAANGSGTSYSLGQSITVTGDMILYAQWSEINYTVTYKANGGNGTDYIDTITYSEAQSYTVQTAASASILPPSGFTFDSWNTAANRTGTSYAASATITVTGNLTLYAQWKVTISYNSNGGTGTIASQTVYYTTTSVTLSSGSGFTKTGYLLQNWNTAANGSGTTYSLSQTITATGDMTLYAIWKEIVYITITPSPSDISVEASKAVASNVTVTVNYKNTLNESKTANIVISSGTTSNSQATDGIYSSTTSQSLSPTSDSSYVYEIA
ncbi:MAG: InlB B-repeat-containing protein [Acholeplasmataceae bacterium]